ncbi:NADPH-dependent FMN reductase [Streptomyces capitiformicae]|uniref:FMN reductase n=1 Tax=Streptomyces capitiformicae TaxID=2014920 RepID=A0A918Z1L4_9ACTN|nr:NAD(P)H-dependent oxidoreductase [Streptomyces capitiformicae]GHE33106.1 FMN reductase [Streptomyces capitiformicae]
MSEEKLRLAVLVGTVRDVRLAPVFAGWFLRAARAHGRFEVDVVDAKYIALPLAVDRRSAEISAEPRKVTPVLASADAFVVVTGEYNHSFPAALKNLIDWHRTEWQAKPVGFVSYGGMSGGLRAVEQLRQVFAELHAMTVRDSISFHKATALLDATGRIRDEEAYAPTVKSMLGQLEWWSLALREARDKRPYEA